MPSTYAWNLDHGNGAPLPAHTEAFIDAAERKLREEGLPDESLESGRCDDCDARGATARGEYLLCARCAERDGVA